MWKIKRPGVRKMKILGNWKNKRNFRTFGMAGAGRFWGSLGWFLVLALSVCGNTEARGQIFPGQDVRKNEQTIGGLMFWQDLLFLQEWHIQRSCLTGDFRLLDPHAVCRASGSREFCERVLEEYRQELGIPPFSGRVLVLMHGLFSGSVHLENMAIWFRQKGEYSAVLNLACASSFMTVHESTEYLAAILAGLKGAERIDFVGHSLGSIILRNYLGKYAEENGIFEKLPIGRFVQLCPPNQGAETARIHQEGMTGTFVKALADLALNGHEMKEQFGVPKCEFAVIAGTHPDYVYYGEETDSVLTVSTTRLDGAKCWKKLNGTHMEIPNSIETFENIRKFLNEGTFLEENAGSPP